jgi:hypothetical protein
MKYLFSAKLQRGVFIMLFFVFALLLTLPNLTRAQTGVQAADREMKLWRFFEPKGGNFRVSLPVQPQATVLPYETPYSTLDLHVFTSKTSSSVYIINYIDLVDVSFKDAKSVEAGFDRARVEILARNPSAVPMGERKVMLGKLPGREFVFDDRANTIKMRMYLVKQRGYIVEVVTPQTRNLPEVLANVYQAESDKFFNSFQILGNKTVETPTKGKKKGK